MLTQHDHLFNHGIQNFKEENTMGNLYDTLKELGHQDPFDQFCAGQAWTKMMDQQTAIALRRRWDRAADLEFLERVRWVWAIQPGDPIEAAYQWYKVQGSQPQIRYEVSVKGGCNCPDGREGGQAPMGWCKHRLMVWQHHHACDQIGAWERAMRQQDQKEERAQLPS